MKDFQMLQQICEFLYVLRWWRQDFHIVFHTLLFPHTSWMCGLFQPRASCKQIHLGEAQLSKNIFDSKKN